MKVPWLPKQNIVDLADSVLNEYEVKTGCMVVPPIPVENIIERSLNLTLDYIDFDEKYGIKGILGATYVKQRMIGVNTKLLETNSEGRLGFTCAHEIGHWVMHKKLLKQANRYSGKEDAIFCRTKDARLPIEWQADYFAANLLMPKQYVEKVWNSTCGPRPIIIHNKKSSFNGPIYFDPCIDNWFLIAEVILKAGLFSNISKQAMIIRLQDLGLIQNCTNGWMGWKTASENI